MSGALSGPDIIPPTGELATCRCECGECDGICIEWSVACCEACRSRPGRWLPEVRVDGVKVQPCH